MARIYYGVSGVEELKRQLDGLGKNFPKSKIRQAANKGISHPLKEARKTAPKKSGELKKGIIKVEEKKWKQNKKLKKAVFQIFFDEAKNSIFQKPLNPDTQGSRGGQTRVPHAYYPISVEYGFHVAHGVRTKPRYFMKKAIERTQTQAVQEVVDHLSATIDKLTR